MTDKQPVHHRSDLKEIARRAMVERGLEPAFPPQVETELGRIPGPARASAAGMRDLRDLLWCSIDNDDSRDLDQLSVSESLPGGAVKLLVAVADVDAVVRKGSAIDEHARRNTTSVYTAAEIFPMLPERLSTDLTSLNGGQDRLAIVVEMTVGADGSIAGSDVYPAAVHNRAKLAYDAVVGLARGEGAGARRRPPRGRNGRATPRPGRGRAASCASCGSSRARSISRRCSQRRSSTERRSWPCGRRSTTAPAS